jgi:hypothetical protein
MKKLIALAAILSALPFATVTFAAQSTNNEPSIKATTAATTAAEREKNAQKAIEALKLFHSVQITYQAREGKGQFATVEDLFRAAYIDGVLSNATGCPAMTESAYNNKCVGDGAPFSGYNFRIFLQQDAAGKPHFVVLANPTIATGENRTGTKSFLVDETGEIKVLKTIKEDMSN